MPATHRYDYAIVRVVPRVERAEFVNAGVIVACPGARYLKAKVALFEARLLALDPTSDLALVRDALAAIPTICAGGPPAGALAKLTLRERFDWLVAPRSSSIQTAPVHSGRALDLDAALDALFSRMVAPPA